MSDLGLSTLNRISFRLRYCVPAAAGSDSYEEASRKLRNLVGVTVSRAILQRHATRIGEEMQAFEREDVEAAPPPAERVLLGINGTGVPMAAREVEGVAGKQTDGTAKTSEAKAVHSFHILLADLSTVVLNDVSIGESESFKLAAAPTPGQKKGIRSPRRQSGDGVPKSWQAGLRESRSCKGKLAFLRREVQLKQRLISRFMRIAVSFHTFSTALRWQHWFLGSSRQDADVPSGIVQRGRDLSYSEQRRKSELGPAAPSSAFVKIGDGNAMSRLRCRSPAKCFREQAAMASPLVSRSAILFTGKNDTMAGTHAGGVQG